MALQTSDARRRSSDSTTFFKGCARDCFGYSRLLFAISYEDHPYIARVGHLNLVAQRTAGQTKSLNRVQKPSVAQERKSDALKALARSGRQVAVEELLYYKLPGRLAT